MTGIEIVSTTDKRLLDRIEFLDCLINIKGWQWSVEHYIDEQELIYDELEKRTKPINK